MLSSEHEHASSNYQRQINVRLHFVWSVSYPIVEVEFFAATMLDTYSVIKTIVIDIVYRPTYLQTKQIYAFHRKTTLSHIYGYVAVSSASIEE